MCNLENLKRLFSMLIGMFVYPFVLFFKKNIRNMISAEKVLLTVLPVVGQ